MKIIEKVNPKKKKNLLKTPERGGPFHIILAPLFIFSNGYFYIFLNFITSRVLWEENCKSV
jgi:hypothetical protein